MRDCLYHKDGKSERFIRTKENVTLFTVLFVTQFPNIWVHLEDLSVVDLTFENNVAYSMEAVTVGHQG